MKRSHPHRVPPLCVRLRRATALVALALAPLPTLVAQDRVRDPLRALQEQAIETRDQRLERCYAYGWQGLADVFSTHRTHSNRPVPVMTFGAFGDLASITGTASVYRDADALAAIYGGTPPHTVDSRHALGDQTQICELLQDAADRGARRLIVLLLDGCDWQTYAAAAVVKSGVWDPEGVGHGLAFFDFVPPVARPGHAYRSTGAVVTSALREPLPPGALVPPGYDIDRGGRFPWSPQDAAYLAGQYRTVRTASGREVAEFDRATAHTVTDSSASATAIFAGRKTLNGRVNQGPDGEELVPLGRTLQARGFTIATVTDVPFCHATPASVYASERSRGGYENIAKQMLGLDRFAGVDVALGFGYRFAKVSYLAAADLERVRGDGRYVVVTPDEGDDGGALLLDAARRVAAARTAASASGARLFGFFGTPQLDHAPFRTADGRYDPTPSIAANGGVEPAAVYPSEVLTRLPDLQELAEAAITVLDAVPERPFLLLVEAGQVDWASHANNLDHAVGEVLSAELCFERLAAWIGERGWWDETLLIVTSDHGHLLQVDLPKLRAATAR
ncbi:MAG: alkaline phosphatase [Planctomycetes bacterium]|nr:alkaline phosphatase [Planctomycetota bacterium]